MSRTPLAPKGNSNSENPGDKWNLAMKNVKEASILTESLKSMLLDSAVFVDESKYSQASIFSKQSKVIKAQERRIRNLEKELDSAVANVTAARAQAREAQSAQQMAEANSAQVLQDLHTTTAVFEVHAKEMRRLREEMDKKNSEIRVLQAIIDTLSSKPNPKK